MRQLFALLLLLPFLAFAQYTPNTNPQTGAQFPFQPIGKTAALAASTTSAAIALSVTANQVQIANPTTGVAFVIFCASSTCSASVGTAGGSTSDYPVAAGAVIVVTIPSGYTYAAAVLSTGSGTLYFTPGIGL